MQKNIQDRVRRPFTPADFEPIGRADSSMKDPSDAPDKCGSPRPLTLEEDEQFALKSWDSLLRANGVIT